MSVLGLGVFDEKSGLGRFLHRANHFGGFWNVLPDRSRESVQLNDFFQNLVDKGFSEIVVRNPDTPQEKTIVISSLQSLANENARTVLK